MKNAGKLVVGKIIISIAISGSMINIELEDGTEIEISGGIDQGSNVVDIEIDGEDFSNN